MEITWFGLSCFKIRSRGLTIVTDPFDRGLGLALPRIRADVVTISRETPSRNAVGLLNRDARVFSGPGEYEVGGVFIIGMDIRPEGRRATGREGRNTVFLLEPDGLRVFHLGGLQHVPAQEQLEEIAGKVDVLLVPVGGGDALNAAQAVEVVGILEPRIVIPMHYRVPGLAIRLDPVDKFLKEMGVKGAAAVDVLKVSKEDLPEGAKIVLLSPLGSQPAVEAGNACSSATEGRPAGKPSARKTANTNRSQSASRTAKSRY